MTRALCYTTLLSFMILFFACTSDDELSTAEKSIIPELPAHFPDVPFPEDNQFSIERWELGKVLFNSKFLSVDSTISCASCHKPALAFTDDKALSLGVEERIGTRNVSTLSNVAYHPYYTRDGGVPTLEMQALVPIQEHNEFDFNIVRIANRMKTDSALVAASFNCYDREPDAFVISRALATYQRSMISANSKYDQDLEGKAKLSESEARGKALFMSERLACNNCHGGFDFSNYDITNNGLYLNYEDEGSFRVSKDSSDLATFKIPSLRNIEMTAPYMHDGSLPTLESVIEHYDNGINKHQNLDPKLQDFELTKEEKDDLVAFLKCLTDSEFLYNPKFEF